MAAMMALMGFSSAALGAWAMTKKKREDEDEIDEDDQE